MSTAVDVPHAPTMQGGAVAPCGGSGQQAPPSPRAAAALVGPGAHAYLQAATRVAHRPLAPRGRLRTVIYAAASVGVVLVAATPSAATLALAAAGATAALVESGVWRRGTVWREALAGRRADHEDGLQDMAPSPPRRERDTVAVASPSPILPEGAVGRQLSGQVGRLRDAADEEDLRARLLAAAAAIRAQGGTPVDMAELQRDGRTALAELRTRRAVENLHGPPRGRPVPARTRTPSGRAERATTATVIQEPPRRPRRRARREPELEEDHPGGQMSSAADKPRPAPVDPRGRPPKAEARSSRDAGGALTPRGGRSGGRAQVEAGRAASGPPRTQDAEPVLREREPHVTEAAGAVDASAQGAEAAAAAAAARVFAFLDDLQDLGR